MKLHPDFYRRATSTGSQKKAHPSPNRSKPQGDRGLGGTACSLNCSPPAGFCADELADRHAGVQSQKTSKTTPIMEIPPEEPVASRYEVHLENGSDIEGFSTEAIADFIVRGEENEFPPELRRKLQLYMSSLTDRQIQTLQLLYWKGLSTSKAAKVMGIARQSLVEHKRRALAKLKVLIQKRILQKKEQDSLKEFLKNIFSDI